MAVKEVKSQPIVEINKLKFTYPGIDGHPPPGSVPLIDDLSLTLHSGDRCLLVGSNGAGKTTILKILGGKHMVEPDMVKVLGRSAFHDTALTVSCDLCYLGGEWRREVAFAGFEVAIQMDVSAKKMIYGVVGVDPQRRDELIKILDIDLSWRMHKVSDGQRRRVQICMGLLKPFKVLLLDEITVDLDVLGRADLLKFLKKECDERGGTIVYATHIFDGLEDWPSHIVHVAHGKLQLAMQMDKVKESSNLSLMRTVESWLRKERDEEWKRRKERKANGLPEYERQVDGTRVTGNPARVAVRALNNGWAGGRLHSTVAGEESFFLSSNRVLRMDMAAFQPVDIISNHPDDVINNILIHLTIHDAVKTSILSRQWRYIWVNLPQLIFDHKLWQALGRDQESVRRKFASIISHVFCFHQGPITKFSLITHQLGSCPEIDHLIYYLSKNAVEEFCFEIRGFYKLPSSLFTCMQLNYLSLASCLIEYPPSVKGFNSLIRLELVNFTIDTEVIRTLISSYRSLEQLKLHIPDPFDCLEIDAPMLKLFDLRSFSSVSFKNSPLLSVALIAAYYRGVREKAVHWNFTEFFDSLLSLQELHVDHFFIESFDADQIPMKLPTALHNLKILNLNSMYFDLLKDLSRSFFLIRSSSNLEILNISNGAFKVSDETNGATNFLKAQDYSNVSLNRLQDVKVTCVFGSDTGMAIMLLMEKSPNLKTMVILCGASSFDNKLLGTLKDLNKFRRASPNAEINIETPRIMSS